MSTKVYSKPLSAGDTACIVDPSSPLIEKRVKASQQFLSNLGLATSIGSNLAKESLLYDNILSGKAKLSDQSAYSNNGYTAGTPADRANEILTADTDAIFCLPGGYGAVQTLPYLCTNDNLQKLASQAPVISGFSDVTPILNVIYQRTGLVTYHAPMVTPNFVESSMIKDGKYNQYTYSYWHKFLFTDWHDVELHNPSGHAMHTLRSGKAAGDIVGGNLQELSWLTGTPYQLDLHDKILFIEDVDVTIPMLDMALAHMYQAGVFDGVKGVIIGDFVDCLNEGAGERGDFASLDARQIIEERILQYTPNVPVLSGLAIGHNADTVTIPIGAYCELDAGTQIIRIIRK